MTGSSLFGRTAIVGIGSTDYGATYRAEPRATIDLAVEAVTAAIADAGLTRDNIDGLIVGGLPDYEAFMFRTRLENVRFLAHFPSGGRLCPHALGQAAMAVEHGMAEAVVLFNAVGFKSRGTRFGGDAPAGSAPRPLGYLYDLAYGMTSPGAQYGLMFSRYQQLYGATEEELAEVPIAVRQWATMNDQAIFQEPITLDDYLAARHIVRPLRIYDYCLVNDGAAAYVVTSAERARELPHPPVLIGGVASRANARPWYASEDFWMEACASLRRDLLDPIGVGLADIDSLQVYDNFSPSILWALEGLGFAPPGEGLDWLAGGRIGPGGDLPVNTSGGMMSESYLQGWNLHVEATRQLRGEAGARQVPDCRRVLYVGLSAVPGLSLLTRED